MNIEGLLLIAFGSAWLTWNVYVEVQVNRELAKLGLVTKFERLKFKKRKH